MSFSQIAALVIIGTLLAFAAYACVIAGAGMAARG